MDYTLKLLAVSVHYTITDFRRKEELGHICGGVDVLSDAYFVDNLEVVKGGSNFDLYHLGTLDDFFAPFLPSYSLILDTFNITYKIEETEQIVYALVFPHKIAVDYGGKITGADYVERNTTFGQISTLELENLIRNHMPDDIKQRKELVLDPR